MLKKKSLHSGAASLVPSSAVRDLFYILLGKREPQ
jgi:hypothetical protein